MKTYKFRAEMFCDVARWVLTLDHMGAFCAPIVAGHPTFPDCVVTFQSTMTLSELKASMRRVADCHVMAEKLALASEYTGERK